MGDPLRLARLRRISTPYWYLGIYAAQSFFSAFEYADVLWLPLATALLLGVFIVRTPLERNFTERFGRLFALLLVLLLLAALGNLMYVTLLLMVQTLPPPAQAFTHLIGIVAIAALSVAVIVIALPPSRLERAIAIRLDAGYPRHRAYRSAGYVALLGVFVFASYRFRQYYLYEHYCGGYIEPQDYVDCELLH
ncbi:MAG TPA: hypothetical protein VF778_14495 [Xanthobacteraceae bacterium]